MRARPIILSECDRNSEKMNGERVESSHSPSRSCKLISNGCRLERVFTSTRAFLITLAGVDPLAVPSSLAPNTVASCATSSSSVKPSSARRIIVSLFFSIKGNVLMSLSETEDEFRGARANSLGITEGSVSTGCHYQEGGWRRGWEKRRGGDQAIQRTTRRNMKLSH